MFRKLCKYCHTKHNT